MGGSKFWCGHCELTQFPIAFKGPGRCRFFLCILVLPKHEWIASNLIIYTKKIDKSTQKTSSVEFYTAKNMQIMQKMRILPVPRLHEEDPQVFSHTISHTMWMYVVCSMHSKVHSKVVCLRMHSMVACSMYSKEYAVCKKRLFPAAV